MAKLFFDDICEFPPVPDDGRIVTEKFLESTRDFAKIFDLFGLLFKAAKYDVQGNITKINNRYEEDRKKFHTLVDIMEYEKETGLCKEDKSASVGLLWLIRGLTLICDFFMALVNDYRNKREGEELEENLHTLYIGIYNRVLKPYHGWFATMAFKMTSKSMPYRSDLLRHIALDNDTVDMSTAIDALHKYSAPLKHNVDAVTKLLNDKALWTDTKCA